MQGAISLGIVFGPTARTQSRLQYASSTPRPANHRIITSQPRLLINSCSASVRRRPSASGARAVVPMGSMSGMFVGNLRVGTGSCQGPARLRPALGPMGDPLPNRLRVELPAVLQAWERAAPGRPARA